MLPAGGGPVTDVLGVVDPFIHPSSCCDLSGGKSVMVLFYVIICDRHLATNSLPRGKAVETRDRVI